MLANLVSGLSEFKQFVKDFIHIVGTSFELQGT